MNITIADIKKMFSYIKKNHKKLDSLMKELRSCEANIVKYNNLVDTATTVELNKAVYNVAPENLDLWDNEDHRIYCESYAFLASDEDFAILLKNTFETVRHTDEYKALVPDSVIESFKEDAFCINYGYHIYHLRLNDIEQEFIALFEPFLGFKPEQLHVISTLKDYMNYIESAINEVSKKA